jgi:hypothetical protein
MTVLWWTTLTCFVSGIVMWAFEDNRIKWAGRLIYGAATVLVAIGAYLDNGLTDQSKLFVSLLMGSVSAGYFATLVVAYHREREEKEERNGKQGPEQEQVDGVAPEGEGRGA